MLLFWASLLTSFSFANPPVIWFGSDAKFLNSGSIIVPGITPAGVCKVDGTGKFSSGSINLATEVTGTLPIANGGTGQTTANAALNALLPSQAGNAGEYLTTDGSNTSWAAVPSAPTGTPNRFTYFDSLGNIASLNNWTVNSYLGSDVSQSPSFADSGVATARIFGQRTLTISPTTDLTTDFLYGELSQTGLETNFDYTNGFTNHEQMVQQNGLSDIGGELINYFPRVHLGLGGLSTSNNSWVIKANNRISPTHTANNLNGIEGQVSMDGGSTAFQARSLIGSTYVGGTADYARGLDQSVQIDGAIISNVYGLSSQITGGSSTVPSMTALYSNSDIDITGDYTGLRLGYTGNIGSYSNDIDIYHEGVVTGNANAVAISRNGANSQGYNFLNLAFNNLSPTTNDLVVLNYGNASTIGDNFTGINLNQTGVVSDSFLGMNMFVGANVGNGVGDNLNAVNVSVASASVVDANVNFFNIFNEGNTTGPNNNSVTALNFNNQGLGYRLTGFNMYNNKDQTEEVRGIFINNDSADARTKTLIDLQSSGNTTDDFQALRINISSETSSSTSQHPTAITSSGGNLSINGAFTPFNSLGVDIGNYISNTSTIQSGSPLTGTDQFVQLVQSNLIANDDISTGPFGLDTTMFGASSQVAVGSGKTIPLLRSMLLGTSVPSGSGGTITEHVALDIIGLLSFGGSVTNTNRTAIQDAILFSQEFCDGATDCWFIKNRDDVSENHLFRLNVNTSTKKNAANTRLEVKDGHFRSDQTTAPTTTVNANAGTGATCTVNGATDTAGTVELVTGSGAWAAGVQCAINFNLVYNTIPKCQLTPGSSTAALATLNTYVGKSTTDISINFVNPDVASTTYQWDYHCMETY